MNAQPAALMRADSRHRLRAAADTAHKPDQRTVFEGVHYTVGNIRARCNGVPTTVVRLLAHQLPIAPKPLPQLEVREINGAIEVLAPAEPAKPA